MLATGSPDEVGIGGRCLRAGRHVELAQDRGGVVPDGARGKGERGGVGVRPSAARTRGNNDARRTSPSSSSACTPSAGATSNSSVYAGDWMAVQEKRYAGVGTLIGPTSRGDQ